MNQTDANGEYIIGCENNDHVKESHVPPNSYDFDKAALALYESAQTGQITKCQFPGLDYVVFVKGSGPHTINYGCAQDKPPKEVIVSRKCAEAVLRGAQVYVPGVLACSAHVEKGDTVAVSVAVEQPGQDGGWGIGMTRGTVLQGLQTDVLEGEIFLQNLPSIITAHALDPQQGERILDMCAAPGGKTTAIAILMKDKGEVVAVDRSHNKVLDIQKLAAEMDLNCITTYKLDALKSVRRRNESSNVCTSSSVAQVELDIDCATRKNCSNEKATETTCAAKAELRKSNWRPRNGPGRNNCMGFRVEKSDGFSPNSFDRVLLDAPCSALGLRPRLFAGEETIESLRNHAKYQRRMFDQAVQLVRPGGVIVYSTCTINPGENEALVRYALDTYKFLTLALQDKLQRECSFIYTWMLICPTQATEEDAYEIH